jgi:hypothetical protein
MGAGMNTRRRYAAERTLRIVAGEVICPQRGRVDLVDCWLCREYIGLSNGPAESLVCGLTEDAVASAFWALDHQTSGQKV